MNHGSARLFWEEIFAKGDADEYSRVELPVGDDPVLEAALSSFDGVSGKRLLDIGCGAGKASLFFASHGAIVTSVDLSETAIVNLRRFCLKHAIAGVDAQIMSAMDVASLGRFDCVYGSMVLHHIEPFVEFAAVLDQAMSIEARGFFWENNMAWGAMRWFREHCVGRFGIPKYGDADESPLTPAEVAALQPYFRVSVTYPEFLFFRLLSVYLLNRRGEQMCETLDRWCYQVRWLRRFGYRQYITLGRHSADKG